MGETKERFAEKGVTPPGAICPILQKVMNDPVIAMDGHAHECSAIEAWFQRSDRSPMADLAGTNISEVYAEFSLLMSKKTCPIAS